MIIGLAAWPLLAGCGADADGSGGVGQQRQAVGGYDHGKATGACSIAPNPAAVGQTYTVSASGLPTTTPVYLLILPPQSAGYITHEQQVTPDANGNWSGTFVADEPDDTGKWDYEFDTTSTTGWTAQKVAVCSVTIR